MSQRTKDRLAKVLTEHGLHHMAAEALKGRYDDYESDSATPIHDLVCDLRTAGNEPLAVRAMNGEWDGTEAEAMAWFEREGVEYLKGISK